MTFLKIHVTITTCKLFSRGNLYVCTFYIICRFKVPIYFCYVLWIYESLHYLSIYWKMFVREQVWSVALSSRQLLKFKIASVSNVWIVLNSRLVRYFIYCYAYRYLYNLRWYKIILMGRCITSLSENRLSGFRYPSISDGMLDQPISC